MGTGGIYAIVQVGTCCRYVGSTKDFRRRFSAHRSHLRGGIHTNPRLQRAWAKHKESAFEFVVLEVIPDWRDLPAREQAHLDAAKAKGEVFNCGDWTDCPARGRRHSVEWIEAQRRGNLGKHRWTPEMKAALRAKWTPEKRAAMAALKRGRPSPLRGRRKSMEHAAKLSAHLLAMDSAIRRVPRRPEARQRMAEAARLSWATGKRRQAETRRREEAA